MITEIKNVILFGIAILLIWISIDLEIKRKQFLKIDFSKEKDYYREILETDSPLILGFIDDYKINKNKLIAELLYMKFKNIIDFENNRIKIVGEEIPKGQKYILKNKDKMNILKQDKYKGEKYILKHKGKVYVVKQDISKGQRYMLEHLVDGKLTQKVDENLFIDLERIVAIDAEKKGLLEEIPIKTSRKSNEYIVICSFIFIFLALYSIHLFPFLVNFIMYVLIVVTTFLMVGCIYFLEFGHKTWCKRTKKGEELNKKIEGLKIYLKDYSMLNNRKSNEIELWENYLIYSVLFGQNKKVIEEYEKYIDL